MNNQFFLNIIILCMFASSISCNGSSSTAGYGKIVTFKKDKTISFPDFKLTYIGERKETSKFPNGNEFTFTYYDFTLKKDNEEKTVSWTAGTGDIGPINFEFAGNKFMIELRYWEKGKK